MMSSQALEPRKNPRQRRSESTVEAVIEAAARILEKDGLKGYNTNAIAQAAGVSIGSLYQYFPNKDAITRALIGREAMSLLAELETIAGHSPRGGAVRPVVKAVVRHLMLRPNLARILDLEEQRLVLQQEVREHEAKATNLLMKCLFRNDLRNSSDAQTLLLDVIAIIRGMVDGAGARGEKSSSDLIDRVERAVRGYLERSVEG